MLHSMTGYGLGEGCCEACALTVELKSVNSKACDLNGVRIPSRYSQREFALRKLLGQRVGRGKIDCTVFCHWHEGYGDSRTLLDAARLQSAASQLLAQHAGQTDGQMGWEALQSVVRLPYLWRSEETEATEEELSSFEAAFTMAIDRLIAYREQEGEALRADLASQVAEIRKLLAQVEGMREQRLEDVSTRLREALEQLAEPKNGVFDEQRYHQELLYHIERLDINEEITRLFYHCEYFLETMEVESAQGRKLAFIAQEMGREINTIGSKSNYAAMQRCVVEMKDHLERIKEQVLNVL